jgi:hypothetical protein
MFAMEENDMTVATIPAVALGFDYSERKSTNEGLTDLRAKLANAESKTNELQDTLNKVVWGGGAAIVVLLVVVIILASRPAWVTMA